MKAFRIALIGWKKAGPLKRNHLCFGHVNKLKVRFSKTFSNNNTFTNICNLSAKYILVCNQVLMNSKKLNLGIYSMLFYS